MANSLFSKKSIYISTILFLVLIKTYGQSINNYGFSTASSGFSYITATRLPITDLGEGYVNDLPIGFDFWYMGAKHTTFSVSTNGFMALSQTLTSAAPTNDLKSSAVRNVIAPLWDDIAIFNSGGVNHGIRYLTTGAEGNRILTVEWREMEWMASTNQRLTLQAKLYEATGAVVLTYQNESTNAQTLPRSASIGISAAVNQFASLTSVTGTPGVSYVTENKVIQDKPASAVNYQFLSTVTAPTGLSFTASGPNHVTLNWTDVSTNNVGYVVHRSTNQTTGFSQVGTMLGADATSYTDTGLAQLTTYYYKVFAVRESLSAPLSGSSNTIISCLETTPAGAEANYKLNGNANDAMGRNQGTFQGTGTTFIADRFGIAGQAYNLNGTDNFMSTAKSYDNPQNFAISMWFKTTTTGGGVLMGFAADATSTSTSLNAYLHDRKIYMTANGRIYLAVYVPGTGIVSINTPASYNDGDWHHVMGVLSNDGMSLYLDGVKVGSSVTPKPVAQLYVGYWRVGQVRMESSWPGWTGGTSAGRFQGAIDDVLLYNKNISDAEAKALYPPTVATSNSGPVCAGSTFNLTATSFTGATYQWTGPNGYTSTTQNPVGIQLTNSSVGVYTVAITRAGGCTTTTATRVDFNKSNPGLWAGKFDGTWSNVNNWCAGVLPTSTINVTIPTTGPSFNPTIISTAIVNDINIQSGRSLTISGGDLQVAGSITNAGTITASDGKVTMNGSTAQVIPASIFANNLIKDLTLNNTAGVALNGALRLTGVLTPSAGIFQTNGNLTLASAATSTASVAAIPSDASVRGAVKVERFLQGGAMDPYRTYRMLSAPVYDNTINFINSNVEGNRSAKFLQLKDNIIISSTAGAAGGFDATHNNQASAWTYFSGYNAITDINTTVNAGKGMYVYFRGNRNNFELKTNAPYTNPENTILDFDGVLNQQDVTVTLNYNAAVSGFNLLGNPYASSIDWNLIPDTRKTSLLDYTISVFNPNSRQYATYLNGIGANQGSNIISSGQSFFVKVKPGGGSFTFKESDKTTLAPPVLYLSRPIESNLVLDGNETSLNSIDLKSVPSTKVRVWLKKLGTPFKVETVMVFEDGRSATYEVGEDAIYSKGSEVYLSSVSENNIDLVINFMPKIAADSEVYLNIHNNNSTGNYALELNHSDMPSGYLLNLNDHFLGTSTLVDNGSIYNFQIDKTKETSFGSNRFSLSVAPPRVLPVKVIYFLATKQTSGVSLQWKTLVETNLKHFQVYRAGEDGVYLKLGNVEVSGSGMYSFFDDQPKLGVNYYKLSSVDLDGNVQENKTIAVDFGVNSVNQITLYPNPAIENFTIKVNAIQLGLYAVQLFNTKGEKLASLQASSNQLLQGYQVDANYLPLGVYFVEVKSLKNGEVVAVQKLLKE